jgi:hypothetical protein
MKMSQILLPAVLLVLGAIFGAARRWIPRSGWIALALCALPVFGFWLSTQFC